MRQEARFLLAIALMVLVLVTTNILFPPVPPEEPTGLEGDVPGQVDGVGGNAPAVPGGAAGGAAATDGAPATGGDSDPFGRPPAEPLAQPSPVFQTDEVAASLLFLRAFQNNLSRIRASELW